MRSLVNSKLLMTLVVLVSMSAGATLPTVVPEGLHALSSASLTKVLRGEHLQRLLSNRSSTGIHGNAPLDWPEFHDDRTRDGNQSSNMMLSKGNAGSLVPVSGPVFTTTDSAMSSPAVYHGILYYATTPSQIVDEVVFVYAVDAMSGQTVWSKQLPLCEQSHELKTLYSSPAVTTGKVNGVATTEVYIGAGGASDRQGCLYDFNGQTGALIWTYTTPLPIFSSPAIMSTKSGSIVVVGDNSDYVRAFSVNYTGSLDGQGVQVWDYNTRYDPPPPGYQQYCQKGVEKCGDAVWSSPAEGRVRVNGTFHHYAYFGVGAERYSVGRVDAIDMDTIQNNSPTLVWSFWDPHPSYSNDFGTILVYTDQSGSAVRVYSGMTHGHMYGLDAVSGQMYFDFSTSAHLGSISNLVSTGTLVDLNGLLELIFGAGCAPGHPQAKGNCAGPNTAYGYIWAIDALSMVSSGTLLWKSQDLGGGIDSSPVVVNQGTNAVIFVLGSWYPISSTFGDLLAIDPTNGALLGAYPIFNQAYGAVSSPAIYGGRIYVTVGYTMTIYANPGGGGLAAFRCAACP